jgi:DeoR/GlpR family transcriptional regulator of sugar metabolism
VRGLSRILLLEEVHAVITDARLPADAESVLEEHVGQVLIAGPRRRRRTTRSS